MAGPDKNSFHDDDDDDDNDNGDGDGERSVAQVVNDSGCFMITVDMTKKSTRYVRWRPMKEVC